MPRSHAAADSSTTRKNGMCREGGEPLGSTWLAETLLGRIREPENEAVGVEALEGGLAAAAQACPERGDCRVGYRGRLYGESLVGDKRKAVPVQNRREGRDRRESKSRDSDRSLDRSSHDRCRLTDTALSCAPPVEGNDTSGGRPANRPRLRPPAGWRTRQVERRRRVSCSALLAGRPPARKTPRRPVSRSRAPEQPRTLRCQNR